MKRVPFMSKMAYKRIRGRTSGRSLFVEKIVEFPPRVLRSSVQYLSINVPS